ncbi:MAG TPA: hypothetical protein PLB31_11840 [Fimbriimonadaceae bacterium]|nr:hypothetical protein [Fimbriimonadaceae bacterium]
MHIKIALTQDDLKKLVLQEISRKLGGHPFDPQKISIRVKSKQNYKAEWEEAELTAANERIRELEDVPRKYVQINGKGPTYCLHGTSSIRAFEALEAALEFEKSQHVKSKDAYHAEREVSDKLEKALKEMVSEKCDYMIRNALGNPEVEHTTKMARAALAEVAALRKKENA